MCGTESRKELPLVSAASGCNCCSTEAANEATAAGDAGLFPEPSLRQSSVTPVTSAGYSLLTN
jgi:hypothetical protein